MQQQHSTTVCSVQNAQEILCNDSTLYHLADHRLLPNSPLFWAYITIYAILMLVAGLMSGLTIGLLSLDKLSLQVLLDSDNASKRRYARRLLPLIKRHHWLLVTLLLGNAACVEAMPLFLDRVSDPITAVLVSVTAVLLFGEVIPQALCTHYGLVIGYYCSPIVYTTMLILSPIAYPISKLLDLLLGPSQQLLYQRHELKSLVGLHGPQWSSNEHLASSSQSSLKKAKRRAILSSDEVALITGALELAEIQVGQVCTPIHSVFMLSDSEQLSAELLLAIADCGHSRVPVHRGQDRSDIIGFLLVKRLLQFKAADCVPLLSLLQDPSCFREMQFVPANASLCRVLRTFRQDNSHMAVVLSNRSNSSSTTTGAAGITVQGIITLRDLLTCMLYVPLTKAQFHSQLQELCHSVSLTLSVQHCQNQLQANGSCKDSGSGSSRSGRSVSQKTGSLSQNFGLSRVDIAATDAAVACGEKERLFA